MRVNAINLQDKRTNTREINKEYLSNPVLSQSPARDTVSFGSEHEDKAEQIAQSKRGNKGWWEWHVFGGHEEALQKARAQLDKEANDLKVEKAASDAIIAAHERTLGQLQSAIDASNRARARADAANEAALAAKEATIIQQGKVVEATRQLADERQRNAERFAGLLEEQKQITKEHEKKNQELLTRMEEALKQKDEKMLKDLAQQKAEMRALYEEQIKAVTANMTKVSNTEAILREIANTKNQKGFGKIGGYAQEKEILTNLVGNAIGVERSGETVDVPNGILFFGPKGNGKSTFADAFAGQIGCRLVKIEDVVNDEANMANLRAAAEKAQRDFEQDRIRTILQVDELEDFAPNGSRITGSLKGFMDSVSSKYHCTVFATTNYPEKINDILLRDGRFSIKVGLAPADEQNAAEVLKRHGQGFADESVKFDELAAAITKPQPEAAFSNARIESVVTKFKKAHTDVLKMTHGDFLQSIEQVGPDITKKALEIFKGQLEYMKRI